VVSDALTQKWITRGRKPSVTSMDAFLMLLIYLRSYSKFSDLGRGFGMKSSTAQDTVMRVLKTIHDPIFDHFVKPLEKSAQLAAGKFHASDAL
jgi:hypothetical protein